MNRLQLRKRAEAFSGFDLTASEGNELIEEARRRFALRSEYPRKFGLIATTESEVAAYDWPTDLLLPKKLSVGGIPWEVSDQESALRFANGESRLNREGVWYDGRDINGNAQLYLYPTPTEAHEVMLEYIFRPAEMGSDSDEPSELPVEFHPGILWEMASTYYETVEDNPELAQRNGEKADAVVGELLRYGKKRKAGGGVFQIPIVGYNA